MNDQPYVVRVMTREELDIAVSWAAAEGWNPGLYDAETFYRTDPEGFIIGLLDDEPIASISAVAYDSSFGFIGFYIVKPEYRGRGYGIQVWNAAMNYLNGRNIGLDGVLEQQANYAKSGFRLAYRNIRFEISGLTGNESVDLVPVSHVPFQSIIDYDRHCFPVVREVFLRSWLAMPNAVSYAKLVSGELCGFGTIRSCGNGYKIGPLFADNETIADEIFQVLVRETNGAPVFLDVPEVNLAAVDLAERYGMNAVFETARMYTHNPPRIDLNRIFGVTTFELG